VGIKLNNGGTIGIGIWIDEMTWAKSDEAKILSYRFARAGVKGFL
jgi:hypothetical protein